MNPAMDLPPTRVQSEWRTAGNGGASRHAACRGFDRLVKWGEHGVSAMFRQRRVLCKTDAHATIRAVPHSVHVHGVTVADWPIVLESLGLAN